MFIKSGNGQGEGENIKGMFISSGRSQFASWLIPRPSHVDDGDLKGMARPVIGREDDGNDGRISLGVMNHKLDKMGDNKLRLDHLSGRQRKTYSEDNSFDLTQSDINLAQDGWPDNEPAYSVRPIPRKRGYPDFSSQYGGSLHFRSWSRNEQLRLNRFSPPRRHFRRPTVSVTVDGTIFDPDVLFTQNITPEPEMSVFRALMSAALTFRRQQRAGAENPFNVMLDWDYQNDCEAIADIFGMTNSDRHLWRIYVRRRRGRVVYRGVCFPPERVLVRPGTRVTLQYS
ncbi:uncharacterized protein LOC132549379 [Ylistrum balloti]|uniref:uncharacterized protein LOC132549379 n=1 Tax=Ylistrum balloti TaxID=509963 RepID=UPI002905DC34|nr:uncharacterized protein LOC132549379 [Ylistrum balloti]